MCQSAEKILEDNVVIDLFEDYFQGEAVTHSAETLGLKSMAVFKDPIEEKRSVSCVSIHPDSSRFCASYSILRFQKGSDDTPRMYVFDTK